MRKGQAEIIGIAIMAVMIITLIMITRPISQNAVAERNEIGALTSMLSATFSCNGEEKPVADFVRMCPESCGCAAVAIDYLLPLAGRRYSFDILKDNQLIFERNTANCPKKGLLLPSENESIEVRLGLC
ncbi:MAG: hypothetical protein V1702_03085 [Candidatus Woesearchaeota archaeon]